MSATMSVRVSKGSPKRAALTEENLKRFEKVTGGYTRKRRRENSRSGSEHGGSQYSRKTVFTANSSFLMCADENGIRQGSDAKQPANLKFLEKRINRRRESPSPTRSEYEVAAHKITAAENERTVAEETSKLLKDYLLKDTDARPILHLDTSLGMWDLTMDYRQRSRA